MHADNVLKNIKCIELGKEIDCIERARGQLDT